MADEKIKTGDLVRLKSGGSSMTVLWVFPHEDTKKPWARCVWIDAQKTWLEKDYPGDALEHADKSRVTIPNP